ncbi:MAG TPA: DinB family protein [Chryseosolibacter sp.]|nr:DinB family protein [Chryseosolibacter sp.]
MKNFLLNTLENSKKYTLDVAVAMPEDGYNSKVTSDTWSFGDLLSHIAYGIEWWEHNYIKGIKKDWAPPVTKTSKKEVMDYLAAAYGGLTETIAASHVNDEIVKGFFMTLDHITHHRGQAVIHLRKHGIVPPEYVF